MTPFNEHIRLAQAMLHGHLYIDPAPPWMEHITIGGHDYILHPPLSALVCLPFVAIGITDQTLICELLAIASVVLVWRLTHDLWLVAFFALGTTMLYEATNGASWDFALVCSTPFTLAAIILTEKCNESQRLDQHRSRDTCNVRWNGIHLCHEFLTGLFAGLAALARYDLVLAWPVYLWVIWRKENVERTSLDDNPILVCEEAHNCTRRKPTRDKGILARLRSKLSQRLGTISNTVRHLRSKTRWRGLLSFVVPLVGVATIYIWFNEARFGTLTDGSVSEWYWHYDTFRAQRPYGLFSIHYIPFNLYTLLFMSPAFIGVFPWIKPQFMGQALLSLSPGFVTARFGPWLMAVMLTSLPALTVYASGFSQLGCRYYVQVFPFLIASMTPARSAVDRTEKTIMSTKVLIIVSIVSSQYFTIMAWTYGLN